MENEKIEKTFEKTVKEREKIQINLTNTIILAFVFILVLTIMVYFVAIKPRIIFNIQRYKAKYNFAVNATHVGVPFLGEKKWKIINSYSEYKEFEEDIKSYLMLQFYKDKHFPLEDTDLIESLIEKEKSQIGQHESYHNWYSNIQKEKFNEAFFKEHNLLIVDTNRTRVVIHQSELKKFSTIGHTANVLIHINYGGHVGGGAGVAHYIVVDKKINNVKLKLKYKDDNKLFSEIVYKPIIYLYPNEETEVNVELGKPESLTHTYPKYINSWNVLAKPNGDLIDLNTGRKLYALYWEGNIKNNSNMKEGFVIKGTDTIKFLEEKLEILGLNEREANEFIIYWLPKLENNKYNYIRFQTSKEIEDNMPLNITPTPDNIIRIVMEFKGLNAYMEVQEQTLETPERNGFVAVEWGGTEIL